MATLPIADIQIPTAPGVAVATIASGVVLYELAGVGWRYRGHRRAGIGRGPATRRAATGLLPAPVLAVLRLEWLVWRGLLRGLFHRPDIPSGATAFTHHRAMAPVRWTFVGLIVVETAVVHLLVPAGTVRVVLLALGLYGLIWLVGYLLGSGPVRPHLVDDDRVVLRCGLTTGIEVPLDMIESVRGVRRERAGTATVQIDGRGLSLVDNGGTSVEIVLREPMTVTLGRRRVDVDTVRTWVDDPRGMVDVIAPHAARTQ